MVQGAVRLWRTAPLPAPGNRYWACPPWRVFTPEDLFEVENDSGRNTQIVLRLRVSVGNFRQMRQQIVELQRPDRKTVPHVPVHANAESRRQRCVRVRGCEHARTCPRPTDQNMCKGRDPAIFPIADLRTKHICKYVVVYVHPTDPTHIIAAEIGHSAQPIPEIVSRGCTATVETEIAEPRCCRIGAKIRVAGGHINLRQLLRLG